MACMELSAVNRYWRHISIQSVEGRVKMEMSVKFL